MIFYANLCKVNYSTWPPTITKSAIWPWALILLGESVMVGGESGMGRKMNGSSPTLARLLHSLSLCNETVKQSRHWPNITYILFQLHNTAPNNSLAWLAIRTSIYLVFGWILMLLKWFMHHPNKNISNGITISKVFTLINAILVNIN